MTQSQLLKYCLFYHGETLPPPDMDGTNAGKLWEAEKMIFLQMSNLVNEDSPALQMAELEDAYVSKWAPFSAHEVMQTYLERCPDDVRSKFH